jgi:hypothetical protein
VRFRVARTPGRLRYLLPLHRGSTVPMSAVAPAISGHLRILYLNIAACDTKGSEAEEPLWRLEIPHHKQVFVGALAEPGEWIIANIETGSSWPVNAQR